MPEIKKIREFAVGFLGIDIGAREIVRLAQLAEENGFGTCWIAEDYFFRGAFSLAAACATQTKSIRIGIGVVNPYTRHPAVIAMELAGLLEVAGPHRVILAVGASNKPWIEKMGIPYLKPRRSLQEAVEIVRAMLEGNSVSYAGQRFQVSEVKFAFPPVVREIPIYLGVVGPKNLELAGEIGDGLLLSVMTSRPYLRYALEHVQRGAHNRGRKLNNFDVQAYLLVSIGKDRKQARNAIKPFIGTLIGMAGFFGPDPILTCTGLPPEEIKPLTELALKGEDVSPLVSDWMLDTFTISGTPEECQERLHLLLETGLTSPVAFETPGIHFEETIRNVRKFLFTEDLLSTGA